MVQILVRKGLDMVNFCSEEGIKIVSFCLDSKVGFSCFAGVVLLRLVLDPTRVSYFCYAAKGNRQPC